MQHNAIVPKMTYNFIQNSTVNAECQKYVDKLVVYNPQRPS